MRPVETLPKYFINKRLRVGRWGEILCNRPQMSEEEQAAVIDAFREILGMREFNRLILNCPIMMENVKYMICEGLGSLRTKVGDLNYGNRKTN